MWFFPLIFSSFLYHSYLSMYLSLWLPSLSLSPRVLLWLALQLSLKDRHFTTKLVNIDSQQSSLDAHRFTFSICP